MTADKKSISLVLGGGGARGLTHIGVIRYLEDQGYDIRYISGSSIGALIGGIYAAGKLDSYAQWVSALEKKDIVRLMDWSFRGGALLKGDRIISVLRDLIGEYNIEDLPIGYTAVATSIHEGREVWLNRGPLFTAIRASTAVPIIFTPVKLGNRLLVDGGLINPIPIAPTLNDDTDLTIAVDLCALPEKLPASKQKKEKEDSDHYRAGINHFIDNLWSYRSGINQFIDNLWSKPEPDDSTGTPSAIDLLTRTLDTMQTSIARLKLAAYSPDILIEIPRNTCGFFEFDRAEQLIEYGYRRAQMSIEKMNQTPESPTANGRSRLSGLIR